jgi:hypothetical protein
MRNITMLFGASILSAAVGCGGNGSASIGGSGTSAEALTSQAELRYAVRGGGSASLHVVGTSDQTGDVVFDGSMTVSESAAQAVDVNLAPGDYTFQVDAYADAALTQLLGSGVAHATLQAGWTTDVTLTTTLGTGSASVQSSVDIAPKISGMHLVTGATGGGLGQVEVDAAAANGGPLSFFWSGFGVAGAVQGGSTITLSAQAAGVAPVVHVVVVDAEGGTATASLPVSVEGSASAGAGASGGASVTDDAGASLTVSASADAGASVAVGVGADAGVSATVGEDAGVSASGASSACASADVQCSANCSAASGSVNVGGLSANTSCTTSCALALAACLAE